MPTPDADPRDCFVAVCPCGGLALAMEPSLLGDPETAAEVSGMVRSGFRVTSMPVAEVREARWCFDEGCPARTTTSPVGGPPGVETGIRATGGGDSL